MPIQCKATTKSGKQCRNTPIEGEDYCYLPSHKEQGGLTDKQIRFVEEYCIDYNATQAAIRAGYSKKTASEIGYENLRKPQISQAVKKRMEELSMRAEEAVKRMTDWGRGSFAPFLEWDKATGTFRINLASESAKKQLHLLKKIKQNETIVKKATDDDPEEVIGRTFEIEIHDAKDAVDKILKILGKYAPTRIDLNRVDWSSLSDVQLERIINGEPIDSVLATAAATGVRDS